MIEEHHCLNCRATYEIDPSKRVWGHAYCPECRKETLEKEKRRVKSGNPQSAKEALQLLMKEGPLSITEILELRGKNRTSWGYQQQIMTRLIRTGFVKKNKTKYEIIEPIVFTPLPPEIDNRPRCPSCGSILVFRKTVDGLVCTNETCELYQHGENRPFMKNNNWYQYTHFIPISNGSETD